MDDKTHNNKDPGNYELQEVSWRAHIDYDLSGSVPLRISPGRFHVSTASRRQAFSTPNCNLVFTYLMLLPTHGYELFNQPRFPFWTDWFSLSP